MARHGAGRLLVIGGHGKDFSLPTAIYGLVQASGIGECSVALPDSLLKLLNGMPGTTFVASTQAGSIGRDALGRLLELAEDADAIAIGAGLSNNSETAVMTEKLLAMVEQPVIAFADTLIALQFNIRLITDRPNTLIILTMQELFKLAGQLSIPISIRPNGGLINKLEIIKSVKDAMTADLVIYGSDTIVATGDKLSVTPANQVLSRLPAAYYAVLSVFWLQNRANHYEGLTTAAWILQQAGRDLKQQQVPTVGLVGIAIAAALEQAEG